GGGGDVPRAVAVGAGLDLEDAANAALLDHVEEAVVPERGQRAARDRLERRLVVDRRGEQLARPREERQALVVAPLGFVEARALDRLRAVPHQREREHAI